MLAAGSNEYHTPRNTAVSLEMQAVQLEEEWARLQQLFARTAPADDDGPTGEAERSANSVTSPGTLCCKALSDGQSRVDVAPFLAGVYENTRPVAQAYENVDISPLYETLQPVRKRANGQQTARPAAPADDGDDEVFRERRDSGAVLPGYELIQLRRTTDRRDRDSVVELLLREIDQQTLARGTPAEAERSPTPEPEQPQVATREHWQVPQHSPRSGRQRSRSCVQLGARADALPNDVEAWAARAGRNDDEETLYADIVTPDMLQQRPNTAAGRATRHDQSDSPGTRAPARQGSVVYTEPVFQGDAEPEPALAQSPPAASRANVPAGCTSDDIRGNPFFHAAPRRTLSSTATNGQGGAWSPKVMTLDQLLQRDRAMTTRPARSASGSSPQMSQSTPRRARTLAAPADPNKRRARHGSNEFRPSSEPVRSRTDSISGTQAVVDLEVAIFFFFCDNSGTNEKRRSGRQN